MNTDRTVDQLAQRLSRVTSNSGKHKARVIDLQSVRVISAVKEITPREVEIFCLENNIIPARYLRNIGTIGIDGQLKLLRSTVAVCGVGGLGGTIVELLARQGIGRLTVIDLGRFEENNLNRQIVATEDDLRKSKVRVAAARIKKINSAVVVTPINKTIDSENVKQFIKNADVVLDGLDNFSTRRLVAHACRRLKIAFVHGAVAGFSGQLLTIFPEDKGWNAVCGPDAAAKGCGMEMLTGNPAATPTLIAAWEVQEAVKIIAGIGHPIRNRLLFLDFAEGTVDDISLS